MNWRETLGIIILIWTLLTGLLPFNSFFDFEAINISKLKLTDSNHCLISKLGCFGPMLTDFPSSLTCSKLSFQQSLGLDPVERVHHCDLERVMGLLTLSLLSNATDVVLSPLRL